MSEQTIEERIIGALREKGPMTSHELCEALNLEWTEFSLPLLKMIRNDFTPNGQISSKRIMRGLVYHLPEQII